MTCPFIQNCTKKVNFNAFHLYCIQVDNYLYCDEYASKAAETKLPKEWQKEMNWD
jgi:hypothetical protein